MKVVICGMRHSYMKRDVSEDEWEQMGVQGHIYVKEQSDLLNGRGGCGGQGGQGRVSYNIILNQCNHNGQHDSNIREVEVTGQENT